METGTGAEQTNRRGRRGQTGSAGSAARDNKRGSSGTGQAGGNTNSGNMVAEVREKSKPSLVTNIESVPDVKVPDVPEVKKERRKKAVKSAGFSEKDINALLQSTFGLISLKAGEHWQITEKEAEQVSKPLSRILEKNDLLEKVANVSDGAMLAVAVATITIPRVIASTEIKKLNVKKAVDKINGTAADTGNKKANNPEKGIGKNIPNDSTGVSSGGDYIKTISPATA